MKRYLLDSNAVTAFINRDVVVSTRVREARQDGHVIGTCEPVVAELYFGLEFSASREANLVRLERGLSNLRSWPFDRAAAREFARVAADLKRRGMKIQVVDIMLAAIAASLRNTTVVTSDADLHRITGLSVENWAELS
jgi:predicted nucleic acid-binding protein